jgi:hypothetical protein
MDCENDCSYYAEPERDDGRLTIADDENEARRKRIDEDFKKIDEIFVKLTDANKKEMKEINDTFQTFISDLRKKYLIEGDNKNDGQK